MTSSVTQLFHTFVVFWVSGGALACPNITTSLVARFTSTNVRTVPAGSARRTWPAVIGAQRPKKTASRKRRSSLKRLVLAVAWQALRRRVEERQAIPRRVQVASARVRHHDAGGTETQPTRAASTLVRMAISSPSFGSMVLPQITAGTINEYRIHRLEESKALPRQAGSAEHHAPRDRDVAPDLQDGVASRMD